MILGLPWGTDIHAEAGGGGARRRGDRSARGSSPTLSDSSRSLSMEDGEGAVQARED